MQPTFKRYRKITPTQARPLTQQDYEVRAGQIITLEGPRPLRVGDYLARDSKGEWPIRREKIERDFRRMTEPDSEGWALYQPLDVRKAAQVPEPFEINGLHAKAGDYLVQGKDSQWPVDREIFEAAYTPVEE